MRAVVGRVVYKRVRRPFTLSFIIQRVDMRNTRSCLLALKRSALLCLLLLTAPSPQALASQSTAQIPSAEINQRVIASLPTWHGKSADIVDHLDLTRFFATRTQWTFVVAALRGSRHDAFSRTVDGGALAVCFINKLMAHCKYSMPRKPSFLSWASTPVHFYIAKVVFAGASSTYPLLLVKTGSPSAVDGNHAIYTQIFMYDRQKNQFKSVFSNDTGSNNNQEARLVEHGPLRGDIVVAEPTSSAPYAYWISVYLWNRENPYSHRTLRYRSATLYGDGNPLAVIDSEMPNILKHFGKWRRGDPLPIPRRLPASCTDHFFLRGGEEWCRQK